MQGHDEIVMYAKDGFKQVQQYKYNPEAQLRLGSFSCIKDTDAQDVLKMLSR